VRRRETPRSASVFAEIPNFTGGVDVEQIVVVAVPEREGKIPIDEVPEVERVQDEE
jgi:hypothetical protein